MDIPPTPPVLPPTPHGYPEPWAGPPAADDWPGWDLRPPRPPARPWRWVPSLVMLALAVVVVISTPTAARVGVPHYQCDFEQSCAVPEVWGGIAWLGMSAVAGVLGLVGLGLSFGRRRPTVVVGTTFAAIALGLSVLGLGVLHGSHIESYRSSYCYLEPQNAAEYC